MSNPIPLVLDDSFYFMKRFNLSPVTHIMDAADYRRGWLFSIPGFQLLKLKVSKLMESPKHITIIKIFNWEFIKE
jgi:hypothetical protein